MKKHLLHFLKSAQHKGHEVMKKLFRYLLVIIGSFLLLPTSMLLSIPKVVMPRLTYLRFMLPFVKAAHDGNGFFMGGPVKIGLSLLGTLGFVLVVCGDALAIRSNESDNRTFIMVLLYLSGVLVAATRFLLFLQHGIAVGFDTLLIIKLVLHFVFALFVLQGLKDEIEIM